MYLVSEQLYLRDQFYWKCLSLYFDNSKSLLSTYIKLCSVCVCVCVCVSQKNAVTWPWPSTMRNLYRILCRHDIFFGIIVQIKKKVQTFSTFSELIIVIFEKKFDLPKFAQFEKKLFLEHPVLFIFYFSIFVKIKRCQVISHFWELREA